MILPTHLAYLAIAGLCLVLHNAVMILADSVAMPLWLAVLASFATVATVGYLLHARFTFRHAPATATFARYVIAMLANLPLAFVTTWFWHDRVGLPMPVAAPMASVCMLAVNFVLSRWAIAARGGRMAVNR